MKGLALLSYSMYW